MLKRPALRKLIALTVLSTAMVIFTLPAHDALAGDLGVGASPPAQSAPPSANPNHAGPAYGGYSMTLSDVWGPAQMPPAPKDFGPHYDWQPEPLSGGLSHDPYPN
jgi:hypothetical protein